MIESEASCVVNGLQKRDEQTMGSLQLRHQMKRELQTLQWSLARVTLLMIFIVPLDGSE